MKNAKTVKLDNRPAIAYGIMGYGRGHAMRSAAVLPALMERYDVTVYAGGDAYDAMAADFPVVRIPTIGYAYGTGRNRGRISWPHTVQKNLPTMRDLLLGGTGMRQLTRELRRRNTRLIISDSEAYTHRAARRLGLPRIGFDHVGIIAYCNPPLPREDWFAGHRDAIGYRLLMGEPDRVLLSSFYPAVPRRPGIEIIPPLMRDEVRNVTPRCGDYLLAYFNKGHEQYLPHVEAALKSLNWPVKVYGTGREGLDGNLTYRPFSNRGFVEDVAGAHAVLSTSGNQLIGESIYFRKPILVLPEDCFEQRLNAFMVKRMGIGERGDMATLSSEMIEAFLINTDTYRRNMLRYRGDGRDAAIETLLGMTAELIGPGRPLGKRSDRVGSSTPDLFVPGLITG